MTILRIRCPRRPAPPRMQARVPLLALPPLLAFSCLPGLGPGPGLFEAGDLRPAALVAWETTGPREAVLRFDEAVSAAAADFALAPGEPAAGPAMPLAELLPGGNEGELILRFPEDIPPGEARSLSGLARDFAGNATGFVLPLWGWNPDPASLLLSEVISEGSSTHPDLVELYAAVGGNLAGLSFFVGTPPDHELRYVFPACAVAAGEYIVLHLKPQGLPGELDETAATDVSAGLDATPTGRDFWYRGEGGALPGKNGALSVALAPMGPLADAFLYSARNSGSDTQWAGFGSAALRDRAAWLAAGGAWLAAGESIAPEDCFPSGATTATRSMCRGSAQADTDSAADWHVVPTKGASPGAPNLDDVYAP